MPDTTQPAAPAAKAARYSAQLRYARISARKMRYVVDLVRGKDYNSALAVLRTCAKRGAPFCKKLLESAAANAVHQAREKNADLDANLLHVVEARVDGGPTIKRFRASSVRRPQQILKRLCHVTFVLEERPLKETRRERSKRQRQDRSRAAKVQAKAAAPAAPAAPKDGGAKPAEGKKE